MTGHVHYDMKVLLLMEEIHRNPAPVEVGRLFSHDLQGFFSSQVVSSPDF